MRCGPDQLEAKNTHALYCLNLEASLQPNFLFLETAGGLQTPADKAHLKLLEACRELVANTDRHGGNISLLLRASKKVITRYSRPLENKCATCSFL